MRKTARFSDCVLTYFGEPNLSDRLSRRPEACQARGVKLRMGSVRAVNICLYCTAQAVQACAKTPILRVAESERGCPHCCDLRRCIGRLGRQNSNGMITFQRNTSTAAPRQWGCSVNAGVLPLVSMDVHSSFFFFFLPGCFWTFL